MSDRGRSPAPSSGGDPRRASSGSRPPSAGGSRAGGSRADSPAPSGSGQSGGAAAGWQAGPGYDPARLSSGAQDRKYNTRMELPPEAYLTTQGKDVFCLRGQKVNTEGAPDMIHTNSIRVTKVNLSKKIYQFDVSF